MVERTRSKRCAPKFCPRMGPTEADNANTTANATGVMRPTTAQPATALSPNGPIARVTKAFPAGVATCVNTAGKPMAKNGLKVARSVAALGRA